MAKRNIAYIKPDEPNFIKRMKAQIGYKEADDVSTKFERNHDDFDEDDKESEEPQVVVLKPGDLTAEEAKAIQKTIEEEPVKADLSQRVIFNRNNEKATNDSEDAKKKPNDTGRNSKSKSKKSKPVLSFDFEDKDEEFESAEHN